MLSDERACQDNDTIRTPLARRGECTLEIVEPSYLQALDWRSNTRASEDTCP